MRLNLLFSLCLPWFVSSTATELPSSHSKTPSSTSPATSPTSTFFHVASGSNDNYFFRDNVTTGQLLLTSTSSSANITRRLVVALPAGNNGALVYFLPKKSSNEPGSIPEFNVELVNGTMKSTAGESGNTGIQVDLNFSSNATFGVTIVGAVRAMRDYVEGSGTMHEIFNYTLASFSSTEVRLHRQYINSTTSTTSFSISSSSEERNPKPRTPVFKSVDLILSIPPGSSAKFAVTPSTNGTFTPPKIDIIFPRNRPVPQGNSIGTSPKVGLVKPVTLSTLIKLSSLLLLIKD